MSQLTPQNQPSQLANNGFKLQLIASEKAINLQLYLPYRQLKLVSAIASLIVPLSVWLSIAPQLPHNNPNPTPPSSSELKK